MLRVELDHIVSEADAAQKILDILKDVEENGETYAIMSNGHPVAAIVSIDQVNNVNSAEEATRKEEAMPMSDPEPQAMETPPAIEELPQEAPPVQPEPELPPMPAMPETPEMPPPALPEAPTLPQASVPAPAAPSFTPVQSQDLGNSPMAEEPPEDVSGPLIAQAPVTQTPPPNLPPLSGTENLRQGFSVPNIPQP